MRILQDHNNSSSPLLLNDEVKESLLNKHPPRQPPSPEAIYIFEQSNVNANVHPILFEQINGKLILESALKSMVLPVLQV